MKKLFFYFLFTLIGVAVVLSLLDFKGEYIAGKKLWKINKEFAKVARDPQAAPAAEFDNILTRYEKFIQEFPKSRIAPVAQIYQGQVYATRKDYLKARKKWEKVLTRKDLNERIAVTALNQISQTYLIEKDYKHALEVLDRTIKNYPFSRMGLQAPLLKTVVYNLQGDTASKERALTNAVSYYTELTEKHKDTEIDFIARQYLAETLLTLNRWKEAINVLRDILLKFPDPRYLTSQTARWIIIRINGVSDKELNDKNIAVDIYREFINKYPQHPLNPVLQDILKNIRSLETKQQNVTKP